MIRITRIIISLIILLVLLSGCYDRLEIDDMNYIIAMGFDKGVTNTLMLTLQYSMPQGRNSGSSGDDGKGGGKNIKTITLDCPTLLSGLNMANNFIGEEINLSHAKVMVFSSELARSGSMVGYIRGASRNREFRPSMFIAVSRGLAKDYIESVKSIEGDPAKYYERKFSSFRYTGFTVDSTLHNFYMWGTSHSEEAVATLVGVGDDKETSDFFEDESDYLEQGRETPYEGDYKAGDLPQIGDLSSEAMGMAAFRGEIMVGEFDGEDATYYLMATGQFDHSAATFPDPKDKRWKIIINVRQKRSPKYKIYFVDNKPVINLKISLEGDFLSIQSSINYENSELRKFFEKSAEEFLQKQILRFLNKTKNLGSDICGFGKHAKHKFLTLEEWANYGWFEKYREASFNVEVSLKIRRPGLKLKTSDFSK